MRLHVIFSTILLCLGTNMALGQEKTNSFSGKEVSIGYARGVNKLHDLQASPMHYYTIYQGIQGDFKKITTQEFLYVGLEGGFGEMVAPDLGRRQFRFEEDGEAFFLVPTQYRGKFTVQYHRALNKVDQNLHYLGFGFENSFFYADGLAMNIWAMNLAELSLHYKHLRRLGERHQLEFTAALPVISNVGRMPYSNVVSHPGRSQSAAFVDNSKWVSLGHYIHPDLSLRYQFLVSCRTGLQVVYRYRWLFYDQPKTIKMSDHQVALSWVYRLRFSSSQ